MSSTFQVPTYQVPFHIFIEILATDIIFMTKELLLDFSNQVLLQAFTWKC